MRSEEARRAVLSLYLSSMDHPQASSPCLQPTYLVTREWLQVGFVFLPRVGVTQPASDGQRLLLLPAQLRPLQVRT